MRELKIFDDRFDVSLLMRCGARAALYPANAHRLLDQLTRDVHIPRSACFNGDGNFYAFAPIAEDLKDELARGNKDD